MDFKAFYDRTRKGALLGPTLEVSEFQGLDSIISYALTKGVNAARLAYILATAYHETAGTMQPIKELGGAGYLTRMYDIRGSRPSLAKKMGNVFPGDGIKFAGRGFVQLTWRVNYILAGKKLYVDLVNNPDLALRLDIAAKIIVHGMLEGWFTGASLSRLPATGSANRTQFVNARPIINGTDKADKIAGYALIFQADLMAAGLR